MLPLTLALAAQPVVAMPATAATPTAVVVDVPVLNHTVERGEPVSAGDFSTEQRPVAGTRGAIGGKAADGLTAKRRLMAGSVVRESDLERPQSVRRGEPVTIVYRIGTMSISTQGRALGGGGVGDPVRVVSLATNHTLDGTIEGAGTVRLAGQ